MPTPNPGEKETKKKWLARCMANDVMVSEFPDSKQRYAICNQKWRDKDKKKSDEEYEMVIKKKKESFEPEIERRDFPISEFRTQRKEGEALKFEGIVARFDTLSADLGGFKEKIAPGAYANTIQKDDIRALFNHNSDYVLGRTKANTLQLEEDDKGLRMINTPPDTQWVKDLAVSIDRGDINQMSFGFRTIKDSWDEDKKIPIRTLEEVELKDVSIVTFPAYKTTRVQTRDLMAQDGLDLDAISRVWVKSQHGLDISDEDCAEIDATIESLSKLKPQVDETIENEEESKPEQTHRVNILRKKLELKERESGG